MRNASSQERTQWGWCWVPHAHTTPAWDTRETGPGCHARPQGQVTGRGNAPDTRPSHNGGRPDSGWRWDAGEPQPLPDPWILPIWYLPADALVHATQAVKGAFPPPQPPGVALLRSLQAGVAWVPWREENGRPGPYFPLVQGQALLHAKDMGTVD